jgi:predicted secreted protein
MIASRKIERCVLIILLICGLSKSIAVAGDYASRDILGFSPDGRYFAFEQYGVEDGSGFPYAEVFVIDASRDKWAEGFPIRKRIEDEKATVIQVRRALAQEAKAVSIRYAISDEGHHLASNPRAELSADPARVTVNAARRFTPPKREPVTFTLTEKPLKSAKCADYSDRPMKGFTLTMEPEGAAAVTLNDDASLPESRGCALGYAIADIVVHEHGGKTTYAVLLHVETVGFEGPDGRFLAVTRRLP